MIDMVRRNQELLRQGRALIADLNARDYRAVGAHFRHVLDYYGCLLAGMAARRIDYDRRARDFELERSRERALARIDRIISELDGLADWREVVELQVRQETPSRSGASHGFAPSSLLRELQVLFSHTVHHYAMISTRLRERGVSLHDDMGVAPSTIAARAGRD